MSTEVAAPALEPGEKLLREIVPDRGRYWRAHATLAVAGMAVVGGVLWAIGNPHAAIGALGAPLAVGVRAAYLYSEQMAARWWLTSQRVLLPGGRAVGLLELETVRPLFGDVQLITRSGDKHLLKYVPDAPALAAEITAARDRRQKRAKG